jgi:hypothetical protein
VAVVDSGLNLAHPHIRDSLPPGAKVVGAALELTQVGTAWEQVMVHDGRFEDVAGHGTACTAALLQQLSHAAPPAAGALVIDALRILGPDLVASPRLLVFAIGLAARRGARLICLPLGLRDRAWVEPVRAAVDEATALGALLCAACHAGGQWSLPAALPGVVAVAADRALVVPALRADPGPPVARLFADGNARPAPTARNFFGTSIACARITGHLAALSLHHPSTPLPQLHTQLVEQLLA